MPFDVDSEPATADFLRIFPEFRLRFGPDVILHTTLTLEPINGSEKVV